MAVSGASASAGNDDHGPEVKGQGAMKSVHFEVFGRVQGVFFRKVI